MLDLEGRKILRCKYRLIFLKNKKAQKGRKGKREKSASNQAFFP